MRSLLAHTDRNTFQPYSSFVLGVVSAADPAISSSVGNTLYAITDSDFTIPCEVTPADGDTAVVWYRDNVQIDSNTDTNFITEAIIQDGVLKADLIKENVQESDAGTYKCEVYDTEVYTLVTVKVSESKYCIFTYFCFEKVICKYYSLRFGISYLT